jgi:integrase
MDKSRRWIKANPLAEVKGQGKRRHGKPQLRPDEGLAWRDAALKLAEDGDAGALAALLLLDGGMRSGEVVTRRVRDLVQGALWVVVDDDDLPTEGQGREAWTPKTERSRRPVGPLPEDLRVLLMAQAEGKPSTAYLFPGTRRRRKDGTKGGPHDTGWLDDQVKRVCRAAGVPERCAHSMRGLRTTLDLLAGRLLADVAADRGHEDERTTLTSYAAPGAAAAAVQGRYVKLVEQQQTRSGTVPGPFPKRQRAPEAPVSP